MVGGTENKHKVVILENCLQYPLKPNLCMPGNCTPRCIPKKSANISYTHQRPVQDVIRSTIDNNLKQTNKQKEDHQQ